MDNTKWGLVLSMFFGRLKNMNNRFYHVGHSGEPDFMILVTSYVRSGASRG